MCCFVAPMAEAIITTIATIVLEHTEKSAAQAHAQETAMDNHRPMHKRLKSLASMLWLVTGILIIDHVMNGELMMVYPFFTAATSPDGISTMMQEIFTIGVAMSAFITLVWAIREVVKFKKSPATEAQN